MTLLNLSLCYTMQQPASHTTTKTCIPHKPEMLQLQGLPRFPLVYWQKIHDFPGCVGTLIFARGPIATMQCKTSCRWAAATMCPRPGLQVVTRDIRHVRIRIGHHYCMSMLACQYNQPKRPSDLDLLTSKVMSKSHLTWATSVPSLALLGLSVLDLGPMYATDRRRAVLPHVGRAIVSFEPEIYGQCTL